MKKTLCYIFLITCSLILHGQEVVPPVKQGGGTGSMTITPDPNDTTKKRINAGSTTPVRTGSDTIKIIGNNRNKAISIIIDHSGSMDGDPIRAAKNSSAIIIDLIKIWGRTDLFPDQIGNIQFQYIQFGGQGQQNVLHPLGRIKDIDKLRNDIVSASTRYSNTDFTMGIDPVVQSVHDSLDHKTIFLTDGQDQSAGPNPTPGYYDALDEIKYIVYGQKFSVGQKGWLSIVNNSEEYLVNDEYEVFAVFVKTLFGFVDNINNYLVRQGDKRIAPNEPYPLTKHSNMRSHLAILSIPRAAAGLKVLNITDQNGKALDIKDYTVYQAATFFNVVLNGNVPAGNYQVNFDPNTISRSHNIHYINFERINMTLKPFTTPDLAGGCFLENSSVNFDFKYWDLDQDIEVAYPDFLSHSAYRYKMFNNNVDVTGKGKKGLLFSQSFGFGSAGNYEVRSAWSYNEDKLKNGDPPLAVTATVCVTQNGSLVHLDYDTAYTWEGREIAFKATVLDQNPTITNRNRKLVLDLGGGNSIDLLQAPSNNRSYNGTLNYVERGRDYTLSLKNVNRNFNFALDSTSVTTFYGRERDLTITYRGKDFSSLKRNYNPDSFWDKLRYAFSPSAHDLPDSAYTYSGKNLAVPYELPYYSPTQDDVNFEISINKVFPDENINIDFLIDSQSKSYAMSKVGKITFPFWPFEGMGWPQTSHNMSDAVTFNFPQQKGVSGNNIASNVLVITKRTGTMNIEEPLYPEPKFTAQGALEFQRSDGATQRIAVPDNTTIISIKTNSFDRMATIWRWWANRVLAMTILGLIAMAYLLPLWAAIRKSRQKVRTWRRLLHNEHLKPQDLWNSPETNQKCNPELMLPKEIKSSFIDENGLESRKVFDSWVKETITLDNQDPKKANKLIKKRIGYQPVLSKSSNTGMIFSYVIFPVFFLAKLVDFWRAAFEVDKNTIKNSKLINYARKAEDLGVPNVPSSFSFKGHGMINITFSDQGDGDVRLRDIKAQGKIAELIIHADYVVVHAKNYALNIQWPNGEDTHASYNDRASSPKGITEFDFEVEDKLFIRVTDIDYEEKACVVATNRL